MTLFCACRACDKLPKLPAPLPVPAKVPVAGHCLTETCDGQPLEALGLARMPVSANGTVVDWGALIFAAWDPTEAAALSLLDIFLETGTWISA